MIVLLELLKRWIITEDTLLHAIILSPPQVYESRPLGPSGHRKWVLLWLHCQRSKRVTWLNRVKAKGLQVAGSRICIKSLVDPPSDVLDVLRNFGTE